MDKGRNRVVWIGIVVLSVILSILVIFLYTQTSIELAEFNNLITQRLDWVERVEDINTTIDNIPVASDVFNSTIDTNTNQLIDYIDDKYVTSTSTELDTAISSLNTKVKVGDAEIDKLVQQYLEELRRKQEEARRQKIASEVARRGSMGRLSSPAVGLDVAIFNSWAQSVCDAPDSACYFVIGGQPIIGDHNYQSFRVLPRLRVGDKVYIDNGTTRDTYRVVDKFKGRNVSTDIVYRDNSGSALNKYANSILMYTCDGPGGVNINIVYAVRE